MTEPIQRVECERKGDDTLSGIFDPFGDSLDIFDDVSGVQGDTNNRRSKIREKKAVETYEQHAQYAEHVRTHLQTGTKTHASHTIDDTAIPSDLRLVYLEMRAGRAAETLGIENLLGGSGNALYLQVPRVYGGS